MKKKTPKTPKKATTPMEQLTSNHQQFMKGKELVKGEAFQAALKTAVSGAGKTPSS